MLVHLRKGGTFVEAAAGFGVPVATAWRCVEEIVALLSARSPKLWAASRKAKTDGTTHLVLDGTLIHDLTAARVWGILRGLEKAGILTLADNADQGAEASAVITPYKGGDKPALKPGSGCGLPMAL